MYVQKVLSAREDDSKKDGTANKLFGMTEIELRDLISERMTPEEIRYNENQLLNGKSIFGASKPDLLRYIKQSGHYHKFGCRDDETLIKKLTDEVVVLVDGIGGPGKPSKPNMEM